MKGSINVVKTEFPPDARRPYRLIETYWTSEGLRTRVCSGVYVTLEEAKAERDLRMAGMFDPYTEEVS